MQSEHDDEMCARWQFREGSTQTEAHLPIHFQANGGDIAANASERLRTPRRLARRSAPYGAALGGHRLCEAEDDSERRADFRRISLRRQGARGARRKTSRRTSSCLKRKARTVGGGHVKVLSS